MDEKTAAKIEAQTEKFNARRDPSLACFLLKRTEFSASWSAVEVTSGFFSEWNNYREQTQFSFATTDTDFRDEFAKATHIAYGAATLDVFEIQDDAKDKIFPDGTSPFYKAYAVRDGRERYTPEAAAAEDVMYLGELVTYLGEQVTYGG